MKTLKHTPGPWAVDPGGFSGASDYAPTWSVTGPPSDFFYLENEADAYLIAAAPDLLKTCMEMIEWFNVQCPPHMVPVGVHRAKEAAAKARGGNPG